MFCVIPVAKFISSLVVEQEEMSDDSPPPPIQIETIADGTTGVQRRSLSEKHLMTPQDASRSQQANHLSKRKVSLDGASLFPPPSAAGGLTTPPSSTNLSLARRPTILHRQAALWHSRSRVDGMFAGNAAHDLNRSTAAQQNPRHGTSTALHFGKTPTAAASTPWALRRRGSAPYGYGTSRTGSLLATPADGALHGNSPLQSVPPAPLALPSTGGDGRGRIGRKASVNASTFKAFADDAMEEEQPPFFADIPTMITVADFSEHANRANTSHGMDERRRSSLSAPSTGAINPLMKPPAGAATPGAPKLESRKKGDPLAHSASFDENGAPLLLPTCDGEQLGGRRRSSIPVRNVTNIAPQEKLLVARRNRSFGGFDANQALHKDHSSGDEISSSGSPRVEHIAIPGSVPAAPHVSVPLTALEPPLSTVASNIQGPRGRHLTPRLSLGGLKQPARSFRRQSYASPEALGNHQMGSVSSFGERAGGLRAPRRRSAVAGRKPELTPFEEFQQALDKAVDQGEAITDSALRRQSVKGDLQFDFTGIFGSEVNASGEFGALSSPPAKANLLDSPQPGGRSGSPRRASTGSDTHDSDGDGGTSSASGSRRGSFSKVSERRLQDFLITPSTGKDDHATILHTLGSENNDSVQDREDRERRSRSEVEMHLYRSSLNPVPLQFVVEEVRQKINRDRMYVDLIYFIPFLFVFTLYFIGRDISQNFFTTASIRVRNTDQPKFQRQVDVLNEFFRIDTQENDGNQSLYMSDDGTNLLDLEFGPQIWRVSEKAKLPYVHNVEKLQSRADILHWLQQIVVPALWDCRNPDYRNTKVTNIGGNTVLIGAARIRSVRVRPGCVPNAELWHRTGQDASAWDLSCYDSLTEETVDGDLYCNKENPAFGTTTPYHPRLQQTTAMKRSDGTESSTTVATFNETMFPFLNCIMTSTTAVSEQTIVNLRHPCSGHYLTLPFQASCNEVQAALDIIRPSLMEPVIRPEEEDSTVLRNLYSRYNSKVPTNSCSAFIFHPSVRLLVVEYFAYSVSTDSFFRSRMILELVKGGAVVPNHSIRVFRVWTTSSIFQVVLQSVVLMFVVNFVFRMLSDWSTSKRLTGSYFTFIKDPWNVMDVANNVALLASSILTALWWSASYGITVDFNREPRYPIELEEAEELFTMQVYCNAVNVVMIYLKVLKFLRINDRLGIMTKTLGQCQQDIVSLMVLFLFIHTGFSIMSTAIFGTSLYQFRSVDEAFVTLLLALLIGIDYDAMRRVHPTLTPFFFWLFIMTEIYLLLNFFIAILGEGFAQVNQSMHLPSLDLALLRLVDEVRMVFRWSYVRETLMSMTAKRKRNHLKALVDMYACLQEHLRLSLLAVEDLRSHTSREHIPMYFRDMEWWLPKDIYNTLGRQYLLILWEDMLYAYNIKERLNSKSGERMEFARAVHEGVKGVSESFPDVLSLEVQAEVIFDKLEKLPLKIVEWSIAQQQSAARLEQMNDNERRLARKAERQRRKSSAALLQSHAQQLRRETQQQNDLDNAVAQVSEPTFRW